MENKTYLVITIYNDKTFSTIELDEFLYYNLDRVINYYKKFNMEAKKRI